MSEQLRQYHEELDADLPLPEELQKIIEQVEKLGKLATEMGLEQN